MSTSKINNWELDTIDAMILKEGLRISSLYFNREFNLILILLNNRLVLKRSLSDFDRLSKASVKELENYKLSRTGVHWAELDEDLSLRGFLQHEIRNSLKTDPLVA